MAIGKLTNFFGTKTGMAVLGGQLVLMIVFAALYTGYQSSDKCVQCHADTAKMPKLGYPQFAGMTIVGRAFSALRFFCGLF